MTLYINGFIGNDRLLLSSSKKFIPNEGVADFTAFLRDENGNFLSNQTVYFFEKFEPSLRISADPSIIQSSDTSEFYSVMINEEGGRAGAGETIHFFNSTSLMLNAGANKNILSYLNGDEAILTAFVYDGENNPLSNQRVVFKQEGVVLTTETTDNNGEATYTYASQGIGDVTISVECEGIIKTVTLEDCIYYNATEKTRTGTQAHSLYDTNLSVTLPTNAEISFECYVADNNNYDYRYWLMPKSQFTGNTNYPSYAPSYFDRKVNAINTGKRENGSSTAKGNYQLTTSNQYATIKYVKTGTEFSMYADGTLCYTETLSWIDNYTDYTLSMMKWSGNKTMYMKNVKFKKL